MTGLPDVRSLAPLSVCIPAHNEERTIAAAIESVLRQEGMAGTEMEILVGANACTDRTADEVRRMMEMHPGRVRLLEIAAKGKPNAWNELRTAASFDHLIFIDGDVEVERTAFAHLLATLQRRDDLILAQGTNAAVLRDCSRLTRLTRPRPNAENGVFIKTWQDHPCGRMYAIKKRRIEAVMSELGYEEMPNDLIHEDGWLRRVLDMAASRNRGISLDRVMSGEGRYWEVCLEALVYYVPQEWHEDPKIFARTLHAREQLDGMFPEWAAEVRRKQTQNSERRTAYDRLGSLFGKGVVGGFRYVLGQVMRGWAMRKARRSYESDVATGRRMTSKSFARSDSTKRRVGAAGRAAQ